MVTAEDGGGAVGGVGFIGYEVDFAEEPGWGGGLVSKVSWEGAEKH